MATDSGDRIALVTFTDAGYLPLTQELIASLRRFPEAAGIDTCILHAGLDEESAARLAAIADRTAETGWNFPDPWLERWPPHRRARTCPPFVPDSFPGYDIYVWIDADAWVNDWSGVDLLIRGARKGALAIAPEVDRAYLRLTGGFGTSWLFNRPLFAKPPFLYKNARRALGRETARALSKYILLNTGAWALPAGAPHWDAWKRTMRRFLDTGRVYGDQISLNAAVYGETLALEVLPALCNWLVFQARPLWDPVAQRFVEPYLPHAPIGIIHLASEDAMRADPTATVPVTCTDGTIIKRSLRYRASGAASEAG